MTALGDAAADYLAFRRTFGHKLISHERVLTEFVGYLDRRGAGTVTINTAIAWAATPAGLSPRRVAERLSVTRKFAQYLVAFEPGPRSRQRICCGSGRPARPRTSSASRRCRR